MTTKKQILQAIREHCLECCGGSWKEVENCSPRLPGMRECELYQYRFGKDPNPSKARQEIGKEKIKKLHEKP